MTTRMATGTTEQEIRETKDSDNTQACGRSKLHSSGFEFAAVQRLGAHSVRMQLNKRNKLMKEQAISKTEDRGLNVQR